MATHPNKSTATDDYLEVVPGEADWTLDVLDDLFDHYFVSPALDVLDGFPDVRNLELGRQWNRTVETVCL